jgi:hypothetical protein
MSFSWAYLSFYALPLFAIEILTIIAEGFTPSLILLSWLSFSVELTASPRRVARWRSAAAAPPSCSPSSTPPLRWGPQGWSVGWKSSSEPRPRRRWRRCAPRSGVCSGQVHRRSNRRPTRAARPGAGTGDRRRAGRGRGGPQRGALLRGVPAGQRRD